MAFKSSIGSNTVSILYENDSFVFKKNGNVAELKAKALKFSQTQPTFSGANSSQVLVQDSSNGDVQGIALNNFSSFVSPPESYLNGLYSSLSQPNTVLLDKNELTTNVLGYEPLDVLDYDPIGDLEAGEVDYINFNNKEQIDYNVDGRLFWDKSEGLYIRSSSAAYENGDPALLWSSDNFNAGSNLNVSYGTQDNPTLSVSNNPSFNSSTFKSITMKNGSAGAPIIFDRTNSSVVNDTVELTAQSSYNGELRVASGSGTKIAAFAMDGRFIAENNAEIKGSLDVDGDIQLDKKIGFNNDSGVIEHVDTNADSQSGLWSGKDKLILRSDDNVGTVAVHMGNLRTSGGSYVGGKLQVNNKLGIGRVPSEALDIREAGSNTIRMMTPNDNSYSVAIRQKYDYNNPFALQVRGENLLTTETGTDKTFIFAEGEKMIRLESGDVNLLGNSYTTGETEVLGTKVVRDFPSLNGDPNGNGVYYNGYRSYVGIIRLKNTNSKEFVSGRISGARNSFARGGYIEIQAENDPYQGDGKLPDQTRAYVKSVKNPAESRLVEFDYDGDTWIGIEINGGASGISAAEQFEGRVYSQTGSFCPRRISFSSISNLKAYTGSKTYITETADKRIRGDVLVRRDFDVAGTSNLGDNFKAADNDVLLGNFSKTDNYIEYDNTGLTVSTKGEGNIDVAISNLRNLFQSLDVQDTISYNGSNGNIFVTKNGSGSSLKLDAAKVLQNNSVTATQIGISDLEELGATIAGWNIYPTNIAAIGNDVLLGSEYGIRFRSATNAASRNALSWRDVDNGTLVSESFIQGRNADLFFNSDGDFRFKSRNVRFESAAAINGTSVTGTRPMFDLSMGLLLRSPAQNFSDAQPSEVYVDANGFLKLKPAGNAVPTANIRIASQVNAAVEFDASASYSESGQGLQYRFNFDTSSAGYDTNWLESPTFTHTYPTSATDGYTCRVQVRDKADTSLRDTDTTTTSTSTGGGGGDNPTGDSTIAF